MQCAVQHRAPRLAVCGNQGRCCRQAACTHYGRRMRQVSRGPPLHQVGTCRGLCSEGHRLSRRDAPGCGAGSMRGGGAGGGAVMRVSRMPRPSIMACEAMDGLKIIMTRTMC